MEVSKSRRRFEELLKVDGDEDQVMGNVELGMVRVPSELLVDLIHHGDIQHYYDVDAVPVAR